MGNFWTKVRGAINSDWGEGDGNPASTSQSKLPPGVKGAGAVPRQSGATPRSALPRRVPTKVPTDFDQEFFTKILEEIGQRVPSPPGFDQLIQLTLTMGQTMSSIPLTQRFSMALATVGPTTGLDQATVIKTLEAQLKAVAALRQEFEKDVQEDAQQQKGNHAQRAQELENEVAQLDRDISDLQKKLGETKRRLDEERGALNSVDTQLATDRSAFESTCTAIEQGAPSMNWFGITSLLNILEGGTVEGSANG